LGFLLSGDLLSACAASPGCLQIDRACNLPPRRG
jgi:hypothetical protein